MKDRLQATQWLIYHTRAAPHVRPPKNTIEGYRSVTYKEGAEDFVVDKDPGLEHWIDGAGYLILSAMTKSSPGKWARQIKNGAGLPAVRSGTPYEGVLQN